MLKDLLSFCFIVLVSSANLHSQVIISKEVKCKGECKDFEIKSFSKGVVNFSWGGNHYSTSNDFKKINSSSNTGAVDPGVEMPYTGGKFPKFTVLKYDTAKVNSYYEKKAKGKIAFGKLDWFEISFKVDEKKPVFQYKGDSKIANITIPKNFVNAFGLDGVSNDISESVTLDWILRDFNEDAKTFLIKKRPKVLEYSGNYHEIVEGKFVYSTKNKNGDLLVMFHILYNTPYSRNVDGNLITGVHSATGDYLLLCISKTGEVKWKQLIPCFGSPINGETYVEESDDEFSLILLGTTGFDPSEKREKEFLKGKPFSALTTKFTINRINISKIDGTHSSKELFEVGRGQVKVDFFHEGGLKIYDDVMLFWGVKSEKKLKGFTNVVILESYQFMKFKYK